MIKPKFIALVWGVLAWLFACIGLGLFAMFFAGCSVAYPLGEDGRYGVVKASVTYVPPVDLWANPAPFLSDK